MGLEALFGDRIVRLELHTHVVVLRGDDAYLQSRNSDTDVENKCMDPRQKERVG